MALRTMTTTLFARRQRVAAYTRKPRRLPTQRHPDVEALAYYRQLKKLLLSARALVDERLVPELAALVEERQRGDSHPDRYRMDAAGTLARATRDARMDGAGEKISRIVSGIQSDLLGQMRYPSLKKLLDGVAMKTSRKQRYALMKQLGAGIGVDPVLAEPELEPVVSDFVAENVSLIRTLPTKYFEQIENVTIAGVRAGKRHEQIAAELVTRFGAAESRAKLIARDQVGKLFGDLNRVRQVESGITHYVWRTSQDNRVRDEHAKREGVKYSWAEPPEDGYPGFPINCRCQAEPDLSPMLESFEAD